MLHDRGMAPDPSELADRADSLHDAVVPPSLELDYLTGRITLSYEEMKLALGVGDRTMRTAIANGELPSVKIGGRRLFPIRAVERHLEALAYAEAGTLDAWQAAVAKGASANLARSRRKALAKRRYLVAKLRKAHKEGVSVNPDSYLELRAEIAEMERQKAISTKVARDLTVELEGLERGLQ